MEQAEQVKEERVVTANHKHEWVENLDWELNNPDNGHLNGYRTCFCGARQWRLACWTAGEWTYRAPDHLFNLRPDISRRVNGGANQIWIDAPEYIRSYSLIPREILREKVTVIGAGGIGSWLLVCLGKMGFTNIEIWDGDNVSEENIGTQVYGRDFLGGYKATNIRDMIRGTRFGAGKGNTHVAIAQRFTGQQRLTGVVVSCVDSMESRKVIWEQAKASGAVTWLIDGRMGAENALLYTINTKDAKDIETYEGTLYGDDEAVQEPCTAQATVYTGMMLAGLMAKTIRDVLSEKEKYARSAYWNIKDNFQQCYGPKIIAARGAKNNLGRAEQNAPAGDVPAGDAQTAMADNPPPIGVLESAAF